MLRAGEEVEGFLVEEVTPVPELRATAIRATHRQSGARIFHLFAPQDDENCFAVTFPTLVPDNTGLPHILEHAVLAGSDKYPVRDLLFQMQKTSMATYISAFTTRGYTAFPVASSVKRDFFNLAEVYLDSIFHPRLTEDIFRSEGCYLSLENNEDLDSPLILSGICYNEAKSLLALPEYLLIQLSLYGLYPDTPLGRHQAGNPDRMPELTYERFREYHRETYHPSNGLFFFYGNIPTEEQLRFLGPILNAFERKNVEPGFPRQPRWTEPRRVEREYPIGPNENPSDSAYFSLNWIIGHAHDPALAAEWNVLSAILFGHKAAPLKRALLDSGLGSRVFNSGVSGDANEVEFHVCLKGGDADRADDFERTVLETLEELAEAEFNPDQVETAFRQWYYRVRTVGSDLPIDLFLAVIGSWIFGGNPLTFLHGREHLDACRARYAEEPRMFNRIIRDRLLDNPHRLRVVLRPDRSARKRSEAAFSERMAEQRSQLTSREIGEIASSAASLAAAQVKPNSPDALASMPQLSLDDLPKSPRHIPTEVGRVEEITVLRNDVFANGINYLEIDMDLAGLPVELYRWLPAFCEAAEEMGAAGQDYKRIAERRAASTGRLRVSTRIFLHISDPGRTVRKLRFELSTLDEQAEEALRLLEDIVFELDPRDSRRLRDIVFQKRSTTQTYLVDNALWTASTQAARGLGPANAFADLLSGREALRFIEWLAESFDSRADELMDRIERIRDFLVHNSCWTVSFTGSDPVFRGLVQALERWSGRRRCRTFPDEIPPFSPFEIPPREGLAAEIPALHCVKVMPAPHPGNADAPLVQLGIYLANFDYIIPEIRLKGGAYGAGGGYDGLRSILSLDSYCDPDIVGTLKAFDGLSDHIASRNWSRAEIDRAIIGNSRYAVAPLRPDSATATALRRYARGYTDELCEARYRALLRATPGSVREKTLEALAAGEPRAAICVVGSRDSLNRTNERLGEKKLEISDILP